MGAGGAIHAAGTSNVTVSNVAYSNSALASAGAQVFFMPNCSFEAKFEGEFVKTAQTYGGSGTPRYAW
jgi:hypothetical protein